MKKLYSDLLDCYGEEKIRLKKAPAVSTDRIYALANTKAGKENVFMEKKHHRLPVVLAVVVAAVLLMGAGFAAASNNLTSFFQGRWQELTGEEMSQEQLEVIDGFSQEIDSSQISNEITVTIDSAMASQNEMYFLLRMEGDCLQDVLVEGEYWYFEHFYFGIKNAEVAAYCSHIDWHYEEDGVYYWLWECSYDTLPEDVTTLNCSLSMGALHSNYDEEDKDVVINGSWSFDFTVDVSELTTIALDTDIVGISDLEINEFEVSYIAASEANPCGIVIAVMKDGTEISTFTGTGYLEEDGSSKHWYSQWETPIDVSEVDYIYFSDGAGNCVDGSVIYVQSDSDATQNSMQEIDASGTIESDITVTVDSAMASKNEMYFLVKVEGESFMEMLDSGAEWYFERVVFDIDNANMASYGHRSGWNYVEDGVYYSLYVAQYSTIGDDVETLNCSFNYGRLYYFDEDGNQVFIGGPWTIDFTVDVADVTYVTIDTGIEGISEFTISEFGISYLIDTSVVDFSKGALNVIAVMKDGSEVATEGGWQYTGIVDGLTPSDGDEKHWYRQWAVLIDLDEVDYLYFVDVFGEMIEGTVIEFG
ncbi:MAG: DUF4179 domain-containing protein [Oscillospiraceae bacterium]|nr:DUF4179 domain-containing protein [Oscillospiraceae bacterium]